MNLPDATFDVYFATDDQIIECTACHPDAGDAEAWPSWCDEWRFEPTEADYQWAADNLELPPVEGSPAEDDPEAYTEWSRRLEELHQASRWQDQLEQIHAPRGLTDDDVAAAGLPVG